MHNAMIFGLLFYTYTCVLIYIYVCLISGGDPRRPPDFFGTNGTSHSFIRIIGRSSSIIDESTIRTDRLGVEFYNNVSPIRTDRRVVKFYNITSHPFVRIIDEYDSSWLDESYLRLVEQNGGFDIWSNTSVRTTQFELSDWLSKLFSFIFFYKPCFFPLKTERYFF